MLPPPLAILEDLTTSQLERVHAAATIKMRDRWRCALAVALDTPVLAGADVARAMVSAVGEGTGPGMSYGAVRRRAQRFLDWWDAWFVENPLATDPAPERLDALRRAVERELVSRREAAAGTPRVVSRESAVNPA